EGTFTSTALEERAEGTDADVAAWIDAGATFIRMELSRGGDSRLNNWHSPTLTKCWLNQSGKYFAILAQPDGNVVDLSLRDVTDTTDLDLAGGGSIINQYGWFISEHYMGNSYIGIFGGDNSTISVGTEDSTVTIETLGESRGTIANKTRLIYFDYLDGNSSFYNRFTYDTAPDGGTIRAWTKFDGWRLVDQSNKSFKIKSITFASPPTMPWDSEGRDVTVVVEGDASVLDGRVWVTFDTPYTRYNSSQIGPIVIATFDQGISGDTASLCGDMSYLSAPMRINIPANTIVGVCGGRFWGLWATGRVTDNDYLPLIVTTPSGAKGISCLYNTIAQEDWVFYKDAFTNRVTIRKGQLSFREYPQKMELSYGYAQAIEDVTFPITLNDDYDRTKKLIMDMPTSTGGPACTFQIGG
ncbi:MAG: hypothetical protein QF535_15610, partial [Anaerolineales bacterium]|nr:hypothetical protein [Anaerolineales bacterium]